MLSADPPLYRRQPEDEQEDAAVQELVKALVEVGAPSRVSRAVCPMLDPEPFQQAQVDEQQRPDHVGQRCSFFHYFPSFRWAKGLAVSSSGIIMETMTGPIARKTCPAIRPKTPADGPLYPGLPCHG